MTESAPPNTPQRVLLVRRSALGDVIVGLPAAVALRRAWPHAHIAWLVEDRFADVVRGHPCLDEVVVIRRYSARRVGDWVREAKRVGRELRERNFDLAIDLQGRAKSALMCYLSGAPRRVGFVNEFRGLPGMHMINEVVPLEANTPAVERTLVMLRYLGVDPEPVEFGYPLQGQAQSWAKGFLEACGLGRTPLVAMVLGASRANKCWPPEHFAVLINQLRAEGLAEPLLIGGHAEAERAELVQELCEERCVSAVGRTDLPQLAALLARARAIVAGDTGAIHMGVALGRPVVGLYGPTSPVLTGPWGPDAVVLWNNPPCGPCVRRPTCRDYHCMREIAPERVKAAIRELLRRKP